MPGPSWSCSMLGRRWGHTSCWPVFPGLPTSRTGRWCAGSVGGSRNTGMPSSGPMHPRTARRLQSGPPDMRAVRGDSLDSLEAYRLAEVERPSVRPGHVLVHVVACGVGFVDALLALGKYQVKPPTPHTPGQEISGVVEEVGAGVDE